MQASKDIKFDKKPLSPRAIDMMKSGHKIKSDTGEGTGLRVECDTIVAKMLLYRYEPNYREVGHLQSVLLD